MLASVLVATSTSLPQTQVLYRPHKNFSIAIVFRFADCRNAEMDVFLLQDIDEISCIQKGMSHENQTKAG
jgi:hypothetical protein